MEQSTIERLIKLELPNSINLRGELWDKPAVPRVLRFLMDSFPLVTIGFFVTLLAGYRLVAEEQQFSWLILVVSVWVFVTIATLVTYHFVVKKQRGNNLRYREAKTQQLCDLFAANGYVIPEKEHFSLISSGWPKFRVTNQNGIKYRVDFLIITEECITATLYLSDTHASLRLREEEQKKKRTQNLQSLVEEYVAEHGEFGSNELREAFIEGARKALE